MVSKAIAGVVSVGDLGTTFGGGPLACAAIEAVIDTIKDEQLLHRVRILSARLRERCVSGPVVGVQGTGFLLGLRTTPPAQAVRDWLLENDILVGTSADPHVVRLLPPYVLEDEHVDRLVESLTEFPE